MPSVKEEAKDRVTKEDHAVLSNVELVEGGLILPSGEINWNYRYFGGLASGPCGIKFKEAFSCFHYSQEGVKGSECVEQFIAFQDCLQRHPKLYPPGFYRKW